MIIKEVHVSESYVSIWFDATENVLTRLTAYRWSAKNYMKKRKMVES